MADVYCVSTVFFSDVFDAVHCWEQVAGIDELSWIVYALLTACFLKELLENWFISSGILKFSGKIQAPEFPGLRKMHSIGNTMKAEYTWFYALRNLHIHFFFIITLADTLYGKRKESKVLITGI